MEKATGRSVAFSSFKITANFNIVTHCRGMWIRVQISAGFSITHILQEVPTDFHSVLIICKWSRRWRWRSHHWYSKGWWWRRWHVKHLGIWHRNMAHWWHRMCYYMRVPTWFAVALSTQEILANNCKLFNRWMVHESALICWSWTLSTCKISADRLQLWVFHTNWSQ